MADTKKPTKRAGEPAKPAKRRSVKGKRRVAASGRDAASSREVAGSSVPARASEPAEQIAAPASAGAVPPAASPRTSSVALEHEGRAAGDSGSSAAFERSSEGAKEPAPAKKRPSVKNRIGGVPKRASGAKASADANAKERGTRSASDVPAGSPDAPSDDSKQASAAVLHKPQADEKPESARGANPVSRFMAHVTSTGAPAGEADSSPDSPHAHEADGAGREQPNVGEEPASSAPGPDSETAASPESAERPSASRRRAKKRRRWPFIGLGVLIAAVLAASGYFAWNRWLRFDDAADIQGVWQARSEGVSLVIDAAEIHLTGDVAYAYELDTWEKTISFSFGDMSGSGAYRFSSDRQTLVIEEGAEHDLAAEILATFGLGEEVGADVPGASGSDAAADEDAQGDAASSGALTLVLDRA